jgi:flagellar basal-body rod modification protein FlgD
MKVNENDYSKVILPGIDKEPEPAFKVNNKNAEERIKQQKMEFLSMLVVQLQHQDPTEPMDANAMAQQIFAINGVEQQLETNKLLTSIHQLLNDTQASNAASFIGKLGHYEGGNKFSLLDTSKPVQLRFNIEGAAKDASITIYDNKGNIVHTDTKEIKVNGLNDFIWKPTSENSLGGYSYEIKATPKSEKAGKDDPIKIQTYGYGVIEGVITEKGKNYFEVDGKQVPSDKFIQIKNKPADIPIQNVAQAQTAQAEPEKTAEAKPEPEKAAETKPESAKPEGASAEQAKTTEKPSEKIPEVKIPFHTDQMKDILENAFKSAVPQA